jgi:O-antigen ligase
VHLQYRKNLLAVRQPHDTPLEFLAETGVVGGVLGVGAVAALLVAGALAAFVPARRASRTEPVKVLRES